MNLSKQTIKFIDGKRSGSIGEFPETIEIDEAYLSLIQYEVETLACNPVQPYFKVELICLYNSEWLKIRVSLIQAELLEILNKSKDNLATIFRTEIADKSRMKSIGTISIRKICKTYIHSESINLQVIQFIFSKDFNLKQENVSEYYSPMYFRMIQAG